MSKSFPENSSNQISTSWADSFDPEVPLPEYPRPQMVRNSWKNLNGVWRYTITNKEAKEPKEFPHKIVVPFPIESELSKVKKQLKPDQRLWYSRMFEMDSTWKNGRVLLHFGAVDWECSVFINGQFIGKHQGGYDPFWFDITNCLIGGENKLLVSVWDPTDSEPIQRGKQVLNPGFIWYTSISGIWQTVWLENVPESYISSLKITPDIDQNSLTVESFLVDPMPDMNVSVRIFDDGKVILESETNLVSALTLKLNHPKLWSPKSPYLYDLEVRLIQGDNIVDQVKSYFGMRKFSLDRDDAGSLRFCLNNQPLFLYGPLDQGYWPDGLYTPPSNEAMHWEINFLKKAGFNMLRKHVKVEPALYYYYCDKAGIIVWQDMVSGGISPKPLWFKFAKMFKGMRDDRFYWRLGRGSRENRRQFKKEYKKIIDSLYNFVSIGIWGPFNEGWGQFDAVEISTWTKTYDPSRLVDHASGWFDQGAGDFKSDHIYKTQLNELNLETERGTVLSEFGGFNLREENHSWNSEEEFGYKKFMNKDDLTENYLQLIETQLLPLIRAGLSAAVYTQTTDVETEVNGFLTYDRKIIKMDLSKIRKMHERLYQNSPK